MLPLKISKRFPVLDRVWLVHLGIVPQDLSSSDWILRPQCVCPSVRTTVCNPLQIHVPSIKDLVDRTLLIDNGVHRLEVGEVVILLGERDRVDEMRSSHIAVNTLVLEFDLVEERVPVRLTR